MIRAKLDEFCRLGWNIVDFMQSTSSFVASECPMNEALYMASRLHWIVVPSTKSLSC
jgi:hypothetical protein